VAKYESSITLNEKLLEEFANKLETSINKVCDDNTEFDPRLELLVTLGYFAAQVSVDTGYSKDEFIALVADMYDDFNPEKDSQVNKSILN
jgi:hypothetical protein